MKISKGTWRVDPLDNCSISILDTSGKMVKHIAMANLGCGTTPEEARANAILISKAPDLLRFLEEAVAALETYTPILGAKLSDHSTTQDFLYELKKQVA